ncbi:MAG: amidohydrolase family protein [Phycisphaerae bacterium]|nr:amidohydrolase family protein [Phycisphaerae bacterium]
MILTAAWVLPVSTAPIRKGFVQLAADRIVAVGSADALRDNDESVIDLGEAILVPGLVNPHTHLELTCYAGRIESGPFWSWLPHMIKLRRAPGQVEREQQGVLDGAWQSLRAGVTCVGDISRRNLNWQVLKMIPIRKVCFVELLTLADDPPRDPDELRAALAEVREDPLLTVGVTPHAPYSVPADQIRASILLADELQRPWCTHWAETREEREFLLGRDNILPAYVHDLLAQCDVESPRLAAIDYLEQCCEAARPGALAHFNYAEPGDAERLAAAGHVVMYCPRAHRYFGHPPHPYREMMQAGVTVAIGTDSAASNENLALLEELRFLRRHTPNPPSAETLLEMVTIHAARALGLHKQIGSLEAGKQADLVAFPCLPTTTDPMSALLDQAPTPTGVWVAGRQVL